MSLLVAIIVGGIAGWIASIIMKTDASMGIFANIVVGVLGAFIGSFIFNMFGGTGADGFNIYSIFVSVVGAVILLAIIKMFRHGSAAA